MREFYLAEYVGSFIRFFHQARDARLTVRKISFSTISTMKERFIINVPCTYRANVNSVAGFKGRAVNISDIINHNKFYSNLSFVVLFHFDILLFFPHCHNVFRNVIYGPLRLLSNSPVSVL